MEGVRPAAQSDLGRVVELARDMRGELGPLRGGSLWLAREARREPLLDSYAGLLARDDRCCFLVGTLDDVVVGFGVGEVEDLADGRRLGVVTDLFVELPAREVGVGEALIGDLVQFFLEQGCVVADAAALPGHRATKNFFEEQGFTARAIVMHRALRPPPASAAPSVSGEGGS